MILLGEREIQEFELGRPGLKFIAYLKKFHSKIKKS